MVATVWTVGHSDHDPDAFIGILREHGITAVADVRSQPHSRLAPHFGKQALQDLLRAEGLSYVFLGRELGGRCEDDALRTNGRLDYDKLAATEAFHRGLERVRSGAARHRVALLCAEHDPIYCHRAILVCRHLHGADLQVVHIHRDGHDESHGALERRLLAAHGLQEEDLFTPLDARLSQAYRRQGEQVAWEPPGGSAIA